MHQAHSVSIGSAVPTYAYHMQHMYEAVATLVMDDVPNQLSCIDLTQNLFGRRHIMGGGEGAVVHKDIELAMDNIGDLCMYHNMCLQCAPLVMQVTHQLRGTDLTQVLWGGGHTAGGREKG